MSKPFKGLQNKALHQGLYLAYVQARGSTWTTNGHIMVDTMLSPVELQPLKNQDDYRGHHLTDVDFILDKLEANAVRADVEREWTSEAGLQLLQSRGLNRETNEEFVVNVQAIYVDYINARFGDVQWYVTPSSVYAVDESGKIITVIAPVKEEYTDELGK